MALKFRVELVWKDDDDKAASSVYLALRVAGVLGTTVEELFAVAAERPPP